MTSAFITPAQVAIVQDEWDKMKDFLGLSPDIAATPSRAKPLSPPRPLSCCCCGQRTTGRQWWNRDAGYGVCTSCGDSTAKKEGAAAARSYYGERGVHWGL
jgi:hypothetical protein